MFKIWSMAVYNNKWSSRLFLANLGLCSYFPGTAGLTLARPLAKDIKAGSSLLGKLSMSSLGEEGRDASNWVTCSSFVYVHESWM